MHTEFDKRMKSYEKEFTSKKIDKSKWVYARIDGRSFSKFTKKMEKPFDAELHDCFITAMKALMKESNASLGFTQSDEISLLWEPLQDPSEFMFSGKIQKLTSVLASITTSAFYDRFITHFGSNYGKLPAFDCRIINLPSMDEACNMLTWRKQDAFRNAVQSAAHFYFGHKKLMHRSTTEKIEMMADAGIDFFEIFNEDFRLGTSMKPVSVVRPLTDEEKSKIPSGRAIPETVTRTEFQIFYDPQVMMKFIKAK
jgi:tRNA(His) 5'-end guanylyltransferase